MRDHGYARYRLDGCRCYECGWARSEYDMRRDRLIAYGQWEPFVPIAETQFRIHSLRDLGFGDRQIALLAGLNRKAVRDIRTGVRHDPGRGNPALTKIRKQTAAAIAAIPFDPMQASDGTYIDGARTWERIERILADGHSKVWLARQVVSPTAMALQIKPARVSARNARSVRDLSIRLGLEPSPPPSVTERHSAGVVSASEILAEIGWEEVS